MEITIFDHLDRDWEMVAASRSARRRIASWKEPARVGLGGPGQIIEATTSACHPAESDAILVALARRGDSDDLAARILLQALLPGGRSLAAQYASLGTRDEVTSTVVAIMTEKIRSYPFERRPERIAANVLGDTRHSLYTERRRHALLLEAVGPSVPLSADLQDVPDVRHVHPAVELESVIGQAVAAGAITRASGNMALAHRVFDVPLQELLPDVALGDTRRRHRLRVERAMVHAADLLDVEL